MKCDWRREKLEYLYRKRFDWKIAEPIGRRVTGRGSSEAETGCGGVRDIRCVSGRGQNYCVVGGCLLSLSLYKSGFQDLLRVRLGNYPKENILHSEHGDSLKSRMLFVI